MTGDRVTRNLYDSEEDLAAFEYTDYAKVLEKALPYARTGHPDAQCMISLLYQCGFGVERDLAKAEEWLLRAAAQNYALAWNNLGTLYSTGGEGLSHGPDEANRCYARAKELGFDCAETYPPPSR